MESRRRRYGRAVVNHGNESFKINQIHAVAPLVPLFMMPVPYDKILINTISCQENAQLA
jgi:hypothetical protein